MEIEFEQVDKKHINIVAIMPDGTRKEIGRIFSPAGTTEDVKNAIQICGFSEAYDFWGCSLYERSMPKNLYMLKKITEQDATKKLQCKDIQLLFDPSTEKNKDHRSGDCWTCFNDRNKWKGEECACKTDPNYFKVWRERELAKMDLIEYVPGKETGFFEDEVYKE